MRKLTLEPESLDVQSFEPVDSRRPARGTILAAEDGMTGPVDCVTITCGDSKIRACFQDD